MANLPILDLYNFVEPDAIDSPYVLTSPRSLEACARFGIKPVHLLPKTFDEFEEEYDGDEKVTVAYKKFEKDRLKRLHVCREERERIIDVIDENDASSDHQETEQLSDGSFNGGEYSRGWDVINPDQNGHESRREKYDNPSILSYLESNKIETPRIASARRALRSSRKERDDEDYPTYNGSSALNTLAFKLLSDSEGSDNDVNPVSASSSRQKPPTSIVRGSPTPRSPRRASPRQASIRGHSNSITSARSVQSTPPKRASPRDSIPSARSVQSTSSRRISPRDSIPSARKAHSTSPRLTRTSPSDSIPSARSIQSASPRWASSKRPSPSATTWSHKKQSARRSSKKPSDKSKEIINESLDTISQTGDARHCKRLQIDEQVNFCNEQDLNAKHEEWETQYKKQAMKKQRKLHEKHARDSEKKRRQEENLNRISEQNEQWINDLTYQDQLRQLEKERKRISTYKVCVGSNYDQKKADAQKLSEHDELIRELEEKHSRAALQFQHMMKHKQFNRTVKSAKERERKEQQHEHMKHIQNDLQLWQEELKDYQDITGKRAKEVVERRNNSKSQKAHIKRLQKDLDHMALKEKLDKEEELRKKELQALIQLKDKRSKVIQEEKTEYTKISREAARAARTDRGIVKEKNIQSSFDKMAANAEKVARIERLGKNRAVDTRSQSANHNTSIVLG